VNVIFVRKTLGDITPGGEAARRLGYQSPQHKYLKREKDPNNPQKWNYHYEDSGSKTPSMEDSLAFVQEAVTALSADKDLKKVSRFITEADVLAMASAAQIRGEQMMDSESILKEITMIRMALGVVGELYNAPFVYERAYKDMFSMAANNPTEYNKKLTAAQNKSEDSQRTDKKTRVNELKDYGFSDKLLSHFEENPDDMQAFMEKVQYINQQGAQDENQSAVRKEGE
jgi:hypothetical protein